MKRQQLLCLRLLRDHQLYVLRLKGRLVSDQPINDQILLGFIQQTEDPLVNTVQE